MKEEVYNGPLVLFDGICNFCDSSINFAIRHDKSNSLRFAPLQSDIARSLMLKHQVTQEQGDSMVLIENGKAFLRSSAALRIARHLNGLYPALYAFIIVPPFIRDLVYNFIAKNRYRWFGKRESCLVPTAEMRSRFIS